MRKLTILFTGNVFGVSKHMSYGGERILLYIIEELVNLGHDIYCFMRAGSDFSGIAIKDYIPVGPLQNDRDVHYEAVNAYLKATKLKPDLYFAGYFGEGWEPKILDRFNYVELTWCKWCHIAWQLKKQAFNTVSYSRILQQDFLTNGVETIMIHYGLPKDLYSLIPEKDDYAVFIGKLEGGKAPGLAIQLAKAAGLKMVVMGGPYNTGTFWSEVAPHIDNEKVFWVRGVDDAQKFKIMSKAKVFISSNANSWKEHAGIVNLESLAMGTPILGFNRINQDCAIVTDKIIEDGKHGFILNYRDSNDLQEILDKGVPLLNRIHEIDPADCREQFEKRFTAELMARRYEWLFEKVAQGERIETVEIPF